MRSNFLHIKVNSRQESSSVIYRYTCRSKAINNSKKITIQKEREGVWLARGMEETWTLEDPGRGLSLGLGGDYLVPPFIIILQKTKREAGQGQGEED